MAHPLFFLVVCLVLAPAAAAHDLQSNEEGYISLLLTNKGVDFAKDVLINKAVSTIIPLQLPDIEKSVKIPLIGKVHMILSNITIYSVNISSSYVETGNPGLVLVASGATASLSMKWAYSYSTWLIVISDSGDASVQVKDMEVGLTVAFKEQGGTLELSLLDCGCHVQDITIKLNGGASWLYQGIVDAFQGSIGSAVENAISKKIKEEIVKLDSLLQSLPKQIPIDHVAALNATFVDSPVLSNSFIELEINGLFTATDDFAVPRNYDKGKKSSLFNNCPAKMIEISLHEDVFNTAGLVYLNAGCMHWIVDNSLNHSFLNTAAWKYVYPQLYLQYPNHEMSLNISATSSPAVKIAKNGINVTIYLDVTVNVLDDSKVIPVACISLEIYASCSPQILWNKIAGTLKLKSFTMSLKWSEIGNVHMDLLQPVIFALLETVFIPYVNLHLMRGFPLPLIHGFSLQNAEIHYTESKIMTCSNLLYA